MYRIRISEEGKPVTYGGSFCLHAAAYNSMTSQVCDLTGGLAHSTATVHSPRWDTLDVTIPAPSRFGSTRVITFSIEHD